MFIQNNINLSKTYSTFLNSKTSSNLRSYFDNEIKQQKKNNALSITTISILGTSLLTATVFHKKTETIFKGLKKSLQKTLDREIRLENQLKNYKKRQNKTKTGLFLLQTSHHVIKTISKALRVFTNTDPFKNYYLGVKLPKLVGKSKYTSFIEKITTRITKSFSKLVKNTSIQKYKKMEKQLNKTEKIVKDYVKELNKKPKTQNAAENLENEFNLLKQDINNLSKNKKIRSKDLERKLVEFVEDFDKHYQQKAKNSKKVTETAQDIIKESSKSFVAEQIANKYTANWKNDIIKQKMNITKSLNDKTNSIKKIIEETKQNILDLPNGQINLNMTTARLDTIEEINQKIVNPKNKVKRNELITLFNEEIDIVLNKMNTNEGTLIKPITNLKKAKEIINSQEKGRIEKIRDLISKDKALANQEKYNLVKKQLKNLKDSVNKATTFETENLEGRQRDLFLGGGVFEVISTILPLGLLTREISKKQSREERQEKLLKVGLPVVGGMGVWGYSALVRSFNGPKAILLSLGSGIALNKVGNIIMKNNKTLMQAKILRESNKK